MYKFCNLPTRADELRGAENSRILCKHLPDEDVYQVSNSVWIICRISAGNQEETARDIADAIEAARDAGYQQALAEVRNVLGVKDV